MHYFASPEIYGKELLPTEMLFQANFNLVPAYDYPLTDLQIPVLTIRMYDILNELGLGEHSIIPVIMIDDSYLGERFLSDGSLSPDTPVNGDYTYWVTNVTITQPQSVPEASTYQGVGTFIESKRTDYKEIFYSTNDYSGIIGVQNNSATTLAQNGFMLMSAEFAQAFVDVGTSVISWGGNWKGLKDFMHMEYVEKDRFNDK